MLKLPFNLQRFAEGESDESSNDSQVLDLQSVNDAFGFSDNTFYDEEGNPTDGQTEPQIDGVSGENSPAQTSEQQPNTPVEQPQQPEQTADKRPQTPEENAQFAAQRRAQQETERLQAEAQRIAQEQLQNSYEVQVARQLEQIYGMPIDQIAQQMEQARLQAQSEQTGVPVEYLQQQNQMQQQIQQLQQQASEAQFNNWYTTKMSEKAAVLQQFPMLDDNDINEAITGTISQFRNPNMPLSQAVMAMHGQKIVEGLQNTARQNALAEVSGRETGPLGPQGTRPNNDAPSISAQERTVMQKMGISEKDWLSWKDRESL